MEWEKDSEEQGLLPSTASPVYSPSSSSSAPFPPGPKNFWAGESRWGGRAWILGGLIAVLVLSAGGAGSRRLIGGSGSSVHGNLEEEQLATLSFELTTEGGGRTNRLAEGMPDYPWQKLFEPHREATLVAQFEGEGTEVSEPKNKVTA